MDALQLQHGILPDAPAPSVPALEAWLDAHGVKRSEGVRIANMADGSGLRVLATRDLEVGETICRIPKQALLSLRTSTLAPLPPVPAPSPGVAHTHHTPSQTVLGLALALLHELRLGAESAFYGYLQALPRAAVPIPALWPLAREGSDAQLAGGWLVGTEAERDLLRREAEGVGLEQAREFYAAAAAHLPPTSAHPDPSPFAAFAYACSLVSTRAFVIDLYHTIALCPFADLLNHAAVSHTSLASDDFVCHRCGSLAPCAHDICRPGEDEPARLEHLTPVERARISNDEDTVDMYVELPVRAGREVMNSYGDGIGEARLLVEWAFVPGSRPARPSPPGESTESDETESEDDEDEDDGFVGDGLTWDVEQLLPPVLVAVWRAMDEGDAVALSLYPPELHQEQDDEEASLLCAPSLRGTYHLNHAGQVSVRVFGALWLAAAVRAKIGHHALLEGDHELGPEHGPEPDAHGSDGNDAAVAELDVALPAATDCDSSELVADLLADINHLEATWAAEQEGEPVPPLQGALRAAAVGVRALLAARLAGLAGGRGLGVVYDLREALPPDARLQAMAMTVVINEIALLTSALERWDELLESAGGEGL